MVWLDPDHPEELFGGHWLASCTRPAPLRFRAGDYGTADAPVGAEAVRAELAAVVATACDGPVRMLTQPRRWGWLFNPITFYFAWSQQGGEPVGVVAEVTNTPWHERHRYGIPLDTDGNGSTALFDKSLHVSPFLGEDCHYVMRVRSDRSQLRIDLDVVEGEESPTLETRLILDRQVPTRRRISQLVLADALSTYKVSGGIYANAARLWRKGVPFVPHPGAQRHGKREMST